MVVVEIPSSEIPRGLLRDYQILLANPCSTPPPNSRIERPAENIWLIPLDGGMHFLGGLLHELSLRQSLQVRILQLGKDWSWLDAKKIV